MHGNQHVSIYNAGVAVSARVWVRVSECASMGACPLAPPISPSPHLCCRNVTASRNRFQISARAEDFGVR